MTVPEILNKWAEYSEYDPEQTRFNLLSSKYEMHRASEKAKAISAFDSTGKMAVLYLKEMYRQICERSSVRLISYLKDPNCLKEHLEMWQIFQSDDVTAIEDDILGGMNALIEKIVPVKQIGERDKEKEREVLAEAVTSVTEELRECHEVLYTRGKPFGKIQSMSTEIHVFPTITECILTLEQWPDSIYLVYIRNRDTADGYFSFFLKGNGNLLEITERVEERYPGQHSVMRSRWAEKKKYNLFPYQLMQDPSNYDNHGYALNYRIDDSNLKLFNLGPDAYIPLVLSIVMLANKYSDMDLSDRQISFVDALLPRNLEKLLAKKETALIIPEGSQIVAINREYRSPLTSENVLDGSLSSLYDHTAARQAGVEKHYDEVGTFPTEPNIFVETYGAGFQLDTSKLLVPSSQELYLPRSNMTEEVPTFEFIGTQNRLDLLAYKGAREQLAEYIRDNMFAAYQAFGGRPAVNEWWKKVINDHKDKIFELCIKLWNAYLKDQEAVELDEKTFDGERWYSTWARECINSMWASVKYTPSGFENHMRSDTPFNTIALRFANGMRLTCAEDGVSKATVRFRIEFRSYEEMASVFGAENIPDILRGYKADGHFGLGNSILDCTDACTRVGTVFERIEAERNSRLWTENDWKHYYFNHASEYPDWMSKPAPETALPVSSVQSFGISVVFSKSGLKKAAKRLQV